MTHLKKQETKKFKIPKNKMKRRKWKWVTFNHLLTNFGKNIFNLTRYNAKRATLVQSRIKALNKMDAIEEILEDPTCVFMFPTPDKL